MSKPRPKRDESPRPRARAARVGCPEHEPPTREPPTALYGYARVSSTDQDLATQRAALKAGGCEVVRAEKASGTRRDRRLGAAAGRAGTGAGTPRVGRQCVHIRSTITGRKTGAEMARLYGVSQPTVSRIVAQHRMAGLQQALPAETARHPSRQRSRRNDWQGRI